LFPSPALQALPGPSERSDANMELCFEGEGHGLAFDASAPTDQVIRTFGFSWACLDLTSHPGRLEVPEPDDDEDVCVEQDPPVGMDEDPPGQGKRKRTQVQPGPKHKKRTQQRSDAEKRQKVGACIPEGGHVDDAD
jgi:hypothetical protein